VLDNDAVGETKSIYRVWRHHQSDVRPPSPPRSFPSSPSSPLSTLLGLPQTTEGWTPLMAAVQNLDVATIMVLLERGVIVSSSTKKVRRRAVCARACLCTCVPVCLYLCVCEKHVVNACSGQCMLSICMRLFLCALHCMYVAHP
jgi:hypothetical protein